MHTHGPFFFPALEGWHCLRGPAGPPSLLFCTPMQRGTMPTGAASETGHVLRFPTVFPSFAGGVLLRTVLNPFVKHVVLVMWLYYTKTFRCHICRWLTPSHKFLKFSFKQLVVQLVSRGGSRTICHHGLVLPETHTWSRLSTCNPSEVSGAIGIGSYGHLGFRLELRAYKGWTFGWFHLV